MDWVRGRPPDALLFLKALVKGTSENLSPGEGSRNGSSGVDKSLTRRSAAVMIPDRSHGIRGALGARQLAERALLGPLREVGTMSGKLRGLLRDGLREKAATRWESIVILGCPRSRRRMLHTDILQSWS